MSRDDLRRRSLEDRVRLAEQDLADLSRQRDEGEIGSEAAASLEARYRADLEEARRALHELSKTEGSEPPAEAGDSTGVGAGRRRAPSAGAVLGVAAGVMVVLTAAIVFLARGSGTEEPADRTLPAPAAPGTGDELAAMEAALVEQPSNNPLRIAIAGAYFDRAEYMRAIDHFLVVTQSDPTPEEAAVANTYLGWITWMRLGQTETALGYLDLARASDPTNLDARVFTGIVLLYGADDGPAAVPYFEDALATGLLSAQWQAEIELMLAEARGGEG